MTRASPVTAPPSSRLSFPEPAVDAVVTGLFALFVGLLFLGAYDSGFPYSGLATLPLLGSLIVLFWANRRAERWASNSTSPLSP